MIKGLTDSMRLRRDGKIRSGKKNEKGYPTNSPHFLLHDAPALINVLGDKPTEIYFTVNSDAIDRIAPNDLRYYTQTELVCMGNGESAAFFALGDHPGVMNEQFPGMNRARKRTCNYKACPDYINGKCSEHILLDMIVPQYSMSSIFTLESTSIIAVLNIVSALKKTWLGRRGKLAGEIFKIYKTKEDVKFMDTKSGKNASRETDVVSMAHIPFEVYEKEFRSKISDENWESLMFLRSLNRGEADALIGAPEAVQDSVQIGADVRVALPAPSSAGSSLPDPGAQEEALKQRANHPDAAQWFEKIASLAGKPNSESARLATAKNFASVQQMIEYLKTKIKDIEKSKKAPQTAPQPPVVEQQPAAATDNLL